MDVLLRGCIYFTIGVAVYVTISMTISTTVRKVAMAIPKFRGGPVGNYFTCHSRQEHVERSIEIAEVEVGERPSQHIPKGAERECFDKVSVSED